MAITNLYYFLHRSPSNCQHPHLNRVYMINILVQQTEGKDGEESGPQFHVWPLGSEVLPFPAVHSTFSSLSTLTCSLSSVFENFHMGLIFPFTQKEINLANFHLGQDLSGYSTGEQFTNISFIKTRPLSGVCVSVCYVCVHTCVCVCP